MTKSELIIRLTERYPQLALADTELVVRTILDAVSQSLATGKRVEIRGFGSFVVNSYKSYTGRNPKTGESIDVKPKKLPFFKVGKELKERVAKS